MSEIRFAALTTAIIVASYAVAMTVSSLARVLAYVGSTGSTSISFILPGIFYWKISDPDGSYHQTLAKEDDDEDDDGEEVEGHEGDETDVEQMQRLGLLEAAGMRGRGWLEKVAGTREEKKRILRRMSLALAIYGVCVMVVCLFTNIFLELSAH